ncbi:MAG: carbohydrate ABC transporter permease [Eubacteriales bacterium]
MSTRKNRLDANDRKIRLFSRGFIWLFILMTVYPIVFVMQTSFKKTSEFYTNIWGLPKLWAFENYVSAWSVANIGEYMLNSLIIVAIVLLVTLFCGALAGYALSRFHIRFAELIMLLILLCTMTPSEGVIMPMYLMISKMKIVGTYTSMILPYIGWGLPMTTYIFRNFFNTLPNELLESARIDGCSETKTFVLIATPLMLPAIATNAIFLFVSWWGELLWATVELASSSMKTIPIGLVSFSAQFGTDWGTLSAAVCIVLTPLVIFFLFVQKYFIGGLTGGAVKG